MWVVTIVISLALLICLVLCIPLDVMLHADVDGKPRLRLRFSWFFGLVRWEISGGKKKTEETGRAAKDKKRLRWRDASVIFRILRTKGVLRRLQRLLKDVFSCLQFQKLVADFTIGLGDPADTGLLFAIIGPATALFGSSHRYQVRLEPSFSDDAALQGSATVTIRLQPIRLVPPLPKFALSPVTLRIAKVLILSKWKRKK